MDRVADRSQRFEIIGTLPRPLSVKQTARKYKLSDRDARNVVALVDAEFGQRVAGKAAAGSSHGGSSLRRSRRAAPAKGARKAATAAKPRKAGAKKSSTRKVAGRKKK